MLAVLSAMLRSMLSAMLGVCAAVTFVRGTRRNRLADCERELARHHVRISRHCPMALSTASTEQFRSSLA